MLVRDAVAAQAGDDLVAGVIVGIQQRGGPPFARTISVTVARRTANPATVLSS